MCHSFACRSSLLSPLSFIVCFVSFGNVGLSGGAIAGIIAGAVGGGLCLILCMCFICAAILRICRSRAVRPTYLPNAAYVKAGGPVQSGKDGNVFQSGNFNSHSHHTGPGNMKLAFSPEGGQIVSGEGTDSTGAYVVTGRYSPSASSMDLQKQYRTGTGDSSKNTEQSVEVHLRWNPTSQQFEEKKNAWTRLRKGDDQLIIAPQPGQHRRLFFVQSNV